MQRIVIVAGLWPRDRMDNAGGVQVRERALQFARAENEVTLIVPDRVRASPAAQGLTPSVKVIRCPVPEPPSGLTRRVIEFAERSARGELTPGRAWLNRWLSEDVSHALERAEYVEVHWPAFLPLIEGVRQVTSASCAIVEHDVQTQGLRRRARTDPRAARRVAAKVAASVARRREAQLCNAYDRVLVYSDKDRVLLRAMGVNVPIEVIPLLVPWPARPAPLSSKTVLFTAALYRPENHQSALWLIDHVWPRVREAGADARLVIAGSKPAPSLIERAGDDIVVPGFVDDLTGLYMEARVFAVPLVLGAGVKVKVLEAASSGLPIVSTSIGAEGYPDEIVARADDPQEFAARIVEFLNDDEAATSRARVARSWAQSRLAVV